MVTRLKDQVENKVSVKVGERFSIDVDVNGTAGYQLSQPKFDQSALKLVDAKSLPLPRGIGGAHTTRFTFEAVSQGEHEIEFERRRPWEALTFVSTYKVSVA